MGTRFYGDRAFPGAGKSRRRTNGSLNIDAYLSIFRGVPGKGNLARLVYGPSILLQRLVLAKWKVHNFKTRTSEH